MERRIVVGVDGSAASRAAFAWACTEAVFRDAVLVAVHVLSIPWHLPHAEITEPASDVERAAYETLHGVIRAAGDVKARLEARLLVGDPSERLLEVAAGADLLVVGARGHGFLGRSRLGSVSGVLARTADCPVVIAGK